MYHAGVDEHCAILYRLANDIYTQLWDFWRKSFFPGWRKSKCQVSEARACWGYFRDSREASMAGAKWLRGRVGEGGGGQPGRSRSRRALKVIRRTVAVTPNCSLFPYVISQLKIMILKKIFYKVEMSLENICEPQAWVLVDSLEGQRFTVGGGSSYRMGCRARKFTNSVFYKN